MNLSIRNQIPGTVTVVLPGEVMAIVKVRLTGGQDVTAAITAAAVDELELAPGAAVYALIKSTEVALASTAIQGVSIRNQLPGTVDRVTPDGVVASVRVTIVGATMTAVITRSALDDLGLAPGSSVVALIKSTEISLAAA
ncbi:TOBE domain-containing protein [Streptomyces chiangmaiensis]|uniref:TOBE domain-containing protein n=1 Tax=Streptomyces chiangmaiensis TaxID=766497 RepID=A0ABU7FJ20_9ACTN|nr:TOBE domain-containing protein [Streptomyces chiangmaiensis]MED7823134.1 TOBE domain-containing protein [Streptomyces chiangmaiensis]